MLLFFLLGYIVGGVTFVPLLAFIIYFWFLPTKDVSANNNQKENPEEKEEKEEKVANGIQKGWIRLSNQYQPKMPESAKKLMSGIHSIVSKPKGMFYAVLHKENLVCYESEKKEHPIMALNMKEYHVSIYPKSQTENELYGRTTTFRLVPALLMKDQDDYSNPIASCTLSDENITYNPTRVLYLNCSRRTDKEDWYFAILNAQHTIVDPIMSAQYTMKDNTHFSSTSMYRLILQVQSSQSHRDAAWLNAVMGRIFLAMYKTERLKQMMVDKLQRKLDKTKRPAFLDEILIRSINIGESVPFITDPKLISLTQDGQVIVEANVDYRGGLIIEIETNLNWSYSSLMKPIRMNLILSAKLRKLKGRLMFKLKPPPSNRYWLAFFEMPDMEWKITPIVADKQIKWSLVTNVIESKIREIMLETFVLPNMDDTAFCPSDGDGGIFGEYVLRPKESMHTRSSSTSSIPSSTNPSPFYYHGTDMNLSIKECSTVPEIRETPGASSEASTLLRSRRTRSESGITITTTDVSDSADSTNKHVSESTQSSPTKHRLNVDLFGDHSSWSGIRLRRRRSHEDTTDNDDETVIDALSPPTTLDIAPARSIHSYNNNKKKRGLRNRAEDFITKKRSSGPDYTPLDDEKRQIYAERLAQMRKRVFDSKLTDANSSLNSFVKPKMSANEPSPPPLPPRYDPLHTKSTMTAPPLPTTSRPTILKTI